MTPVKSSYDEINETKKILYYAPKTSYLFTPSFSSGSLGCVYIMFL